VIYRLLAKFQSSPNLQDCGRIKATLIKLYERLSKFSNSQNYIKEGILRENYLSVSISWIEVYHKNVALCSRPTIITVGIKQPGRANEVYSKSKNLSEDCIWSVTEEFTFHEKNQVWCKSSGLHFGMLLLWFQSHLIAPDFKYAVLQAVTRFHRCPPC
jgi:hypothetical protein